MPLADLLARLPSPIAMPLHSYLEETDPRLKLWAMCDTVELLLRLLVFIGIADLARADGKPPQALRKALREPIEHPTLGGWRDMAVAVAEALAQQSGTIVPELPPLVENTLVPLLRGGNSHPENSVLALRNRLAHGGGVPRALAEKLLTVWQEPFKQAMATIGWLGELDLVVNRQQDGYGCLRGSTVEVTPYMPGNWATVAAALAMADAVAVVRGEVALPLWPLVLYGPPHNPYDDQPLNDSFPQVYVRQGDVHLQYTPLGGDVCHSEAGDAALARFQELFHVDREPPRPHQLRFTVRDFRDRIAALANRLVGRDVELATLRGTLAATHEGLIWVAGTAGIGKSSLLARVAQDSLDTPPPNTQVLPYWFDAGDERCQRETFLRFAIERLQNGLRIAPPDAGQDPPKPLQQLRELLQQLNGRRVVFILDGLDEITGRDPHFARDVPLHLRLPGVVWLCAGRPEKELPQLFRPEIAIQPFPDGLPPMREGDIRAMLLDNLTGELCKRLISQDRERGDQIINPFIDKVAKAAQGLPLYVRYVINDIWKGHYRVLDAGERLPPSLSAYHEEHLRRCAVGSLHQVLTPIVALLAVVYEPLSLDILAALLRQRTLIPAGEEGIHLTQAGLAALESMLHRQREEDGQISYTLHHHSLRQHIEESPHTRQAVATAREFLGDAALRIKPDAAAHYLYRYGINHLVEAGAKRHPEALQLLTRFDYLMARFYALADTPEVTDLRTDWQMYLHTGGVLDDEAWIWKTFFLEKEHILRCSDEDWPTYKILLQLAIEHADDSPITKQAEAWLAQAGNCDWVWLRNPYRPEHIPFNPVVQVFEGHLDTVNGAMELSDGRILSWSEDCTLRIWNRDNSNVFIEMKGHTHAVTGAKELPDQRIVSCSKDETLRFWDSKNGSFLEVLEIGQGELVGVEVLLNGNILFWNKENIIQIINSCNGQITQLKGFDGMIDGVQLLPDNVIVCWNYNKFCCWDGNTMEQITINENILIKIKEGDPGKREFASKVLATHFSDCFGDFMNKIWIINDKIMILGMDLEYRETLSALFILYGDNLNDSVLRELYYGSITGIEKLKDNQILIWENNNVRLLKASEKLSILGYKIIGYFKNIDSHSHEIWDINRHFSLANEAKILPDGRILSWDDKTLGLWDCNTGKNIVVSPAQHLGPDSDFIVDVQLLPTGLFLVKTEYCYARLWDSKNIYLLVEEGTVIALPNGNILCQTDQLQICCGATGKVIKELKGHLKGIKDVKLLPDGRILSYSEDSTLRLWDAITGECIKVLEGHKDAVTGAYLISDGRILSWSKDSTLRLWDAITGECIKVLEGHKEPIKEVYLMSNGHIFSWSEDSTWRSWNDTTGECINCINIMEKHADAVRITYILSDNFILSLSEDKILCLWNSKTGQLTESIEVKGDYISKVFELVNGNFLVKILDFESSIDGLYMLDGKTHRLITNFVIHNGENIKTLNDGNFIIFTNYKSGFVSRIINGFTGKIVKILADKEFFVERICNLEHIVYALINDGNFNDGNFGIIKQIDCEDGYKEISSYALSSQTYSYFYNEFFFFEYDVKMISYKSNYRTLKMFNCNVFWCADCLVKYLNFSDDGTYIVSTEDGQVICLKLYKGNQRISPEDLKNIKNNDTK
ncbi:MAG: NACHT domain-containing protein [Candidatus Competibacteraceae bacterium]